jgi:glycosyltransferase involved in cell wall biosynthesis
MKSADGVFVLVNGSDDGTEDKLRELGAVVKTVGEAECRTRGLYLEIDGAFFPDLGALRNEALEMVPADFDICVPVDLDDRWSHDDWPNSVKKAWVAGAGICKYGYIHNVGGAIPDGSYTHDRIHSRRGWEWTGYVHEWLTEAGGFTRGTTVNLDADTYQFAFGAHKYGANYLPLLKKQAEDMPDCARAAHYYGRELMYKERWDDAIAELKRHLALPGAVWGEERAASCRFISRCYAAKKEYGAAWHWANKAVAECDTLREPWVEAMRACVYLNNPHGVIFYGNGALGVKARTGRYVEEAEAWGYYPYEALGWAYEKLGDRKAAAESYKQAAIITSEGNRFVAKLAEFV